MMRRTVVRCLAVFFLAATLPAIEGMSVEAVATSHSFSQPFIEAAKKAQPGVVSVKSRMKKSASRWQDDEEADQFSPEEFWERFFGMPMPEQRPRQQRPRFAYGSGFIVSKDGYILTNNHVVERADSVTVTISDGKEYPAKVIGTDPSTDIAVLHIEATDLPSLTLADSSTVEVGEWVLAVGNPLGLQESVTAGIVLRDVLTSTSFESNSSSRQMQPSIWETRAPPLVNIHGDVIGMNTAIASSNGSHMGI